MSVKNMSAMLLLQLSVSRLSCLFYVYIFRIFLSWAQCMGYYFVLYMAAFA